MNQQITHSNQSATDISAVLNRGNLQAAVNIISNLIDNQDYAKVAEGMELWLQQPKVLPGHLCLLYGFALNALGRCDGALTAHKQAIVEHPGLANAKARKESTTIPNYDEYESPCIGCGSNDSKLAYVCNQSLSVNNFDVLNPIRVWKDCIDCGLTYTSNMPTAEALEKYYSANYLAQQPGGPLYNISEEGREQSYIKNSETRLKVIEEISGGKGRLIDVGAGRGTFVKVAQDKGWTAEGLEQLPENVAYAEKRWGLTLSQMDFFDLDSQEAYDAITLFEVFEHLTRPWEALKKCADMLSPKGVLVIAMPFRDSPYAKALHPAKDAWWSEPAHLIYIDTQCLAAKASEFGLHHVHTEEVEGAGRLDTYFTKVR